MRTIWNGVIHFGASQIPVGLAAARESGDPEFRTLHRACLTPIKQQRVCPTDRKPIAAGDTVKGFEVAPGEYVAIEDAEIEAAAALGGSRQIELLGSIPAVDLDPLAIDRPYFLAPSSARVGHVPYAAFAEAVRAADVAVLCRFYAWGREQLAAIQGHGDGRGLILRTLHWPEDVRADDTDLVLVKVKTAPADRQAATKALARLAGKTKYEKLRSSHRAAVLDLLERKLKATKRRRPATKTRARASSRTRA